MRSQVVQTGPFRPGFRAPRRDERVLLHWIFLSRRETRYGLPRRRRLTPYHCARASLVRMPPSRVRLSRWPSSHRACSCPPPLVILQGDDPCRSH
jgi:hypothetical protein